MSLNAPEPAPRVDDAGAMFDNAVVVHASPNRRPPKGSTRPGSLSWGWPR